MVTRREFLRAMAATAVSGGIYACAVEPYWLETVRTKIALEGLDPAFDGYVIAQISDLHVGSGVPLAYLRRALEAANAAKPDLVVVTGDIVDGGCEPRAAEDAAELLSLLRPRDAVMAVLGNHDTGAFHPKRKVDEEAVRRLRGALAASGVDVLLNEERTVARGNGRLRVAGFGDLWSGQFDARAFRAAPGGATVCLSHNPDTAPELAERGAGLVLCGHTHGGQIRVPGLGPLLPAWRSPSGFPPGETAIEGGRVIVNRGLGMSGGPLPKARFFSRPEIRVIEINLK